MGQPHPGDRRVNTAGFERQELVIDGSTTVVHSAGNGPPLLYFHGGGTFHGIDFARDWLDRFRVIIPYHPNFGQSGDNPRVHTMQHHVLHHLELIDRLGLDRVFLVGFSFGGQMAAQFAVTQAHRLKGLALVAPAGLDLPAHPMPDLADLPPHEVFGYLAHDPSVLAPYLPQGPEPDFIAQRQREGAAVGRVVSQLEAGGIDLARWLHRLRGLPTQLLWGRNDRIVPVGHAAAWQALLPHAQLELFDNAGHLLLEESPAARRSVADFFAALDR